MVTANRLSCVLVWVAVSGCAVDSGTPDVGSEVEPAITFNAITFNAITFNGIAGNAQASHELVQHPLQADSFYTVPALQGTLQYANARQFMSYLFSCAAETGDWMEVDGYYYYGDLGLCPAWRNGPPSQECLRWVSSCILARNNAQAQQVPISLAGEHPDFSKLVRDGWEVSNFPVREGAYYGNLFDHEALAINVFAEGEEQFVAYLGDVFPLEYVVSNPVIQGAVYQNVWSCSDALAPAGALGRVCAFPGTGQPYNCAATYVGSCGGTFGACGIDDGWRVWGDGDFEVCADTHGHVWNEPITVFVEGYVLELVGGAEATGGWEVFGAGW